MLNAPPRFHFGVNEFKSVGLLPVEYRVEQLKLGHVYTIINGRSNTKDYLRENIDMVRRVNGSGRSSFLHTGICQWNNLPIGTKQCRSKKSFKNEVKSILFSRLVAQNQNIYVTS